MGATVQESFGQTHADVYELTHRHRGKDWPAEALDVAKRIRSLHPGARSLLDVGCGTGVHLETFRTCFEDVEGLEVAPAMRDRAERRLAGIEVHEADMRDFALGRTFDAVTSLCCPTGYLDTTDDLCAAIGCMADHLEPGGVLVVEPWWLPERYLDGYVGSDLIHDGGRVVARVSHTKEEDGAAHMHVCWLVGDASGLHAFSFTESFTLFTRGDYLFAFDEAGCNAQYHEGWLTGRGIFVGVRRS